MIGENSRWDVKHASCNKCDFGVEVMLKNLVSIMYSYTNPKIIGSIESNETYKKNKNQKKIIPNEKRISKKPSGPILNLRKKELIESKRNKLGRLQFKIAQRKYNQLIWSNIKKDLMFFRQKNYNRKVKQLKARLRLLIDEDGKIVERFLLKNSGSKKFDESILYSVDLLKLPPPMDILVKYPPYVVTIVIQP